MSSIYLTLTCLEHTLTKESSFKLNGESVTILRKKEHRHEKNKQKEKVVDRYPVNAAQIKFGCSPST